MRKAYSWLIVFLLMVSSLFGQSSPTGVKVEGVSAGLVWDPVTNATDYKVYWGTSPGAYTGNALVGNALPSYRVTISTSGLYYFVVSAMFGSTESDKSNEVSYLVTSPGVLPAGPTGPEGPIGPQGPPGPQGAQGVPGPAEMIDVHITNITAKSAYFVWKTTVPTVGKINYKSGSANTTITSDNGAAVTDHFCSASNLISGGQIYTYTVTSTDPATGNVYTSTGTFRTH